MEDILERFLSNYPEEERENIKKLLGEITPKKLKLMEKIKGKDELGKSREGLLPTGYSQDKNFILDSENKEELLDELEIRLNEEFLNKLIREIEPEQKKNGQGIFALYSLYNPEKASKIISEVNQITDESKRYNVFMTITSLIKKGKVSLEDIDLIACDDKEGIVLESKLPNGKFLIAADSARKDENYPFGHFMICAFEKKVDREAIESDQREEGFSLYHRTSRFIEEHQNEEGNEFINHDCSYAEIGSVVENMYIESNRKKYYSFERLVKAKMEELFKDREENVR